MLTGVVGVAFFKSACMGACIRMEIVSMAALCHSRMHVLTTLMKISNFTNAVYCIHSS